MTGNEYQLAARRTTNPALTLSEHITCGVIGLCGESGECADAVKKWQYQGHGWVETKEKLIEELGDVLWYVAETASYIGVDLDEIMQRNKEKLERRYKEGFTVEESINRGGENDNG